MALHKLDHPAVKYIVLHLDFNKCYSKNIGLAELEK